MPNRHWWKTLFNENYLDIYLGDLTPERTTKEVSFIIKAANLSKSDRILDLACGHGRHCIELVKRGFENIIGLDYSKVFIEKAKKDSQKAKVNIKFIQEDMRKLSYKNEFDVVLSIFTSFGYFSDKTNQKVLSLIFHSLKSDGRFLLDFINSDKVMRFYRQNGERQNGKNVYLVEETQQFSGIFVEQTRTFDFDSKKEYVSRTWFIRGKKETQDYTLRHYPLLELKEIITKAGFKIDKIWGDFDGSPQNNNNIRAIILAVKK